MILRVLTLEDQKLHNDLAGHPLQSWQWGEFKKNDTTDVERVGYFDNGKMKRVIQVFFHKIPNTSFTMGYFPKGYMPDEEQLTGLQQLGKRHNAIAIKLEPNIAQEIGHPSGHQAISDFLTEHGCQPGKALFTRYTFILDLTQSEQKLMELMKSKTRYNVNLAEKKGVEIFENSTKEGVETHLNILAETTKRQGFYAHNQTYFRKMWDQMGESGQMRIFEAHYEGKPLVSWIVFIFGDTLYYPYGASSSEHRDVMASNLMMWEIIKFGKSMGLKKFDMWGALGPNPNEKDPWYGFHRFKEGYGPQLYEFLGTYDLVLNPPIYSFYRFAENIRWKFLRIWAKIRRIF